MWNILYTDHSNNFIHYDSLVYSNPDAKIFLVDISNHYDSQFAWQNSDILIRSWLKNNIQNIDKQCNIALLEWDVLVTKKLPSVKIQGLKAHTVLTPATHKHWPHWNQISNLGKYISYATGIAPFGVLFMDYNTLETWIDRRFDDIYNKNIQNELRLASILKSQNIKLSEIDLPKVCWKTKWTNFTQPEIYHPVKNKIISVNAKS